MPYDSENDTLRVFAVIDDDVQRAAWRRAQRCSDAKNLILKKFSGQDFLFTYNEWNRAVVEQKRRWWAYDNGDTIRAIGTGSSFDMPIPSSLPIKIQHTPICLLPKSDGIPLYQRKIAKGYLSTQQKLALMFWDQQPVSPYRKIYIAKLRKQVETERRLYRAKKQFMKKTGSPRALRSGERVIIVYLSGKEYPGKVFIKDGLAVVEPDIPNTAAWLLNENDLAGNAIDLSVTPYERIIHNQTGMDFLKEFVIH
jgi:hypothetical protein